MAFAALTACTVYAAIYPTNCDDFPAFPNTPSRCQHSTPKQIADFLAKNRSIVQSLHTYVISVILLLVALLHIPQLWSTAWSTMERGVDVATFHVALDLSRSANIWTVLRYLWTSRSRIKTLIARKHWPIAFITLVGLLEITAAGFSAIIFRQTTGPVLLASAYTVGDSSESVEYSRKRSAVRNSLAADATANRTFISPTGNQHIIPFLHDQEVNAMWKADLPAVTLQTSVECGQNDRAEMVQIPADLFSPIPESAKVYGDPLLYYPTSDISYYYNASRISIGQLQAIPAIWIANNYDNAFFSVEGGESYHSMSINVVYIFFGTDVAIQGATTVFPHSSNASSSLNQVDILVCKAQHRFQVTNCRIRHNKDMECREDPALAILSDFIDREKLFSITESVRLAGNRDFGRMPGLSITETFKRPYLVHPIEWYSPSTTWTAANYTLPQNYITDTLFPTAQHAFIQVLLSTQSKRLPISLELRGHFATQQRVLQIVLLALLVSISVVVTISAVHQHASQIEDPSYIRLIAISDTSTLSGEFEAADGKVWDDWVETAQVKCIKIKDGDTRRRRLVFKTEEELEDSKGYARVPEMHAMESLPFVLKANLVNGKEGM